jgi:rhamnogalacturonan endolyase
MRFGRHYGCILSIGLAATSCGTSDGQPDENVGLNSFPDPATGAGGSSNPGVPTGTPNSPENPPTGEGPPPVVPLDPDMPVDGETPPVVPPVVTPASCGGFYAMEALDRGVVAVVQPNGIFVSWRMFGYEYDRDTPANVSYNVYRDGALVQNVTNSTNLLDGSGTAASTYQVAVVTAGAEGEKSAAITPWAENFLRVPLQSPGAIYNAHDTSLGDLDGDGQHELVMLWQPNNAQDNSNGGDTDDVFIDALRLDGTRLWRINLGPNIRAGEHYTQFVVIDADGDGRAELGVKTAPGTVDGTGAFLSVGPAANDDDQQVFRNGDGYVLSGPEYFTVFDGLTGRELDTENYHVQRGAVNSWGDNYGNRVDRFLATAAYLDDSGLPSFVMARGYYTRTTLGAWNFRNGQLSPLWVFDSNQTPTDGQNRPFTGQGAHSLSVANVDADPGQEIIYGAMTVDHDGSGKCSTNLNHGDALHVSDFILDRPGVEVFMPAEDTSRPLWHINDPNTCEIIHQAAGSGSDVGRGAAADVLASNPGAEFWASAGVGLSSATTGQPLGGAQPNSINFLIWWDADELRELENGTAINKLGGGVLQNCTACSSNNGTKSVPSLVADLIGDWREEVIWRETNNSALRIYTTTNVTARRIYTLMHDPQYRVAISWQNVAYNQPPHPSFHIGAGMAEPPVPDIRVGACPAAE